MILVEIILLVCMLECCSDFLNIVVKDFMLEVWVVWVWDMLIGF